MLCTGVKIEKKKALLDLLSSANSLTALAFQKHISIPAAHTNLSTPCWVREIKVVHIREISERGRID